MFEVDNANAKLAKLEYQWEKIKQINYSSFEKWDPYSSTLNQKSWKSIYPTMEHLEKVFGIIGYTPFVLTVKRGKGNPNLGEQICFFSEKIHRINKYLFRYGAYSGLEIPTISFSGNNIDGSYNPHLHCLIFLPKRNAKRILEKILKSSNLIYPEELQNGIIFKDPKEIKIWKEEAFSTTGYVKYAARLEDLEKGKNFNKLIPQLTTFGFLSKPGQIKSGKTYNLLLEKFPEAATDDDLRIKLFAMLHWIQLQKDSKEYLRIFLPSKLS